MLPFGQMIQDATIGERGDVQPQGADDAVRPVDRQAAAEDKKWVGLGSHRSRPSWKLLGTGLAFTRP